MTGSNRTPRRRRAALRARKTARLGGRAARRPARRAADLSLTRAVEAAPAAVAILDANGKLVHCNARARDLLDPGPERGDVFSGADTGAGEISPGVAPASFEITRFPLASSDAGWQLLLFEPDPRIDEALDPVSADDRAARLGYLAGGIAHALQARLGLMETIAEGLDASLAGEDWEVRQSLGQLRRCLLRSHALVDQLLRHPTARPRVPHAMQ